MLPTCGLSEFSNERKLWDRDVKSKVTVGSRTVCAHTIASMLLLSSCGGGSSDQNNLAADDCTPTIITSTKLETEVDINGNISLVPVANNSVSGCGSSATLIEPLIPSSSFETRFENTEDFDVWNCVGPDGASLQYALLSRKDFGSTLLFEKHGFEFDPAAADLAASQQLFGWRVPLSATGDVMELRTIDRIDRVTKNSIESQWTDLRLDSADDFSFTSSITGAMQCTRATSNIDIASSRWDVKCKYRGPISAC